MGLKYEDLEELCETLGHKITEANDKIRMSNGDITGGDLEYVDRLTHALKSVKTTMAMMDAEDGGYSRDDGMMGGNVYSGRSGRYYGGTSYARGRGSNARRDSMGRYSRRGYSRDGGNEEIVEQLREIMHDTKDERTRQEFQKFIQKVESM